MPLIVEIHNSSINQIGGCPEGSYSYVVKVNRKVIASGEIRQDRTKHWSLLLKKIAEDGRDKLFTEVVGVTPEEFKKQRHEKAGDLPL